MRKVLIGCVLGLAAATAAAATDPAPTDEILDEDYAFCHVPGAYRKTVQREWCAWAEDPEVQRRCPGLVRTCREPGTEEPRGCESARDDLSRPPPAARVTPPPVEGCAANSENGPELLRWLGAIAAAAVVLIVLRLVASSFGSRDPAPRPERPEPAGPTRDEPVPDLPSGDLLDSARQALVEGRIAEALLLARAAALRRLGEAGRLRLHRSRTDREYQRQLRGDPALQSELRTILGAVESLRWGGRVPDRRAADQIVGAAERLLAALAVLLLLVVSAPAARASDYGPDGEAALVNVLRAYSYDVRLRLRSLDQLDDETDVMMVDADAGIVLDPAQWETVDGWVERGGVLIWAGGTEGHWSELGERTAVSSTAEITVDPRFAAAGLRAPRWPGGPGFGFDGTCVPLVSVGEEGGPAPVCMAYRGAGVIVAIADPRILRNAAFAHPANVAFAGDLLYTGQSVEGWPLGAPPRVEIATHAATQANPPAESPLASLAAAGLLPFLLQLLATWGLAMAHRGWPFGPLRDPPEIGRVAFAEHVRALGLRWFRGRESGYAWHRLANFWLSRLGRPGLTSAARRAGYPAEAARAWVAEIEQAAAAPPPSERGDTERMEELWRVTSQNLPPSGLRLR